MLRAKLRRIPRFLQVESWDCGLTCVSMLLPNHPSTSELSKRVGTQSIWTIDLAALVVTEEVVTSVKLFTTNAGVLDIYENMSYYSKTFKEDKERVERLLAEAEARGIEVEETSISSDRLISILKGVDTYAIVLVDNSKLHRQSGGYQGHYILVLGYQETSKSFVYYNPGATGHRGASVVHRDLLDIARTAEGTDQDILVIQLTSSTKL